jgi:hypothetical protein
MRNGSRRDGAGRPEMRAHTKIRVTSADAEQLLDGHGGPADLRLLLAAAAGPGTARELAGETAAMAAFAGAPRIDPLPSDQSRRPSMLRTGLSKIFAAKAALAIVLIAGTTGGVALAATSTTGPADWPATGASATTGAHPSTSASSDATTDTADPSAGATDAPPPGSLDKSLTGLCHAFTAGATDNPGAAAENPAFAVLTTAAGGADGVESYCATLLDASVPGRSGSAPGQDGTAPAGSAAAPGPATTAPGRSDTAPGPAGTAPGKGDDPAQASRPAAPPTAVPGAGSDKAERPEAALDHAKGAPVNQG